MTDLPTQHLTSWWTRLRVNVAGWLIGPKTWREIKWFIEDTTRGMTEETWRQRKNLRERIVKG